MGRGCIRICSYYVNFHLAVKHFYAWKYSLKISEIFNNCQVLKAAIKLDL